MSIAVIASVSSEYDLTSPVSVLSFTNSGAATFGQLTFVIGGASANQLHTDGGTLTFRISVGGVQGQPIEAEIEAGQLRFRQDADPMFIDTGEIVAATIESSNANDTDVTVAVTLRAAEPLQPMVRGRSVGVDASGQVEAANMRGTDNAFLAANYTAPDNQGIADIETALGNLPSETDISDRIERVGGPLDSVPDSVSATIASDASNEENGWSLALEQIGIFTGAYIERVGGLLNNIPNMVSATISYDVNTGENNWDGATQTISNQVTQDLEREIGPIKNIQDRVSEPKVKLTVREAIGAEWVNDDDEEDTIRFTIRDKSVGALKSTARKIRNLLKVVK